MASLEQIKTLSVRAAFEADNYVKGAAEKVAADQKMIASDKAVAGAMEQTDRKIGTATTGLNRLVRAIDPAFAAQAKLEQGTRTLTRAFETGKITSGQYQDYLAKLETHYSKLGQGVGKAGQQVTQSSGQMAMGLRTISANLINTGQVAISSNGNLQSMLGPLIDVGQGALMAGGSLGVMTFAMAALAAPVVAGTLALVQHNASVKALSLAYIQAGDSIGLTRAGLEAFAQSASAASDISVREARGVAGSIISTGRATAETLKSVTALSRDYAAITGKDLADAAGDLSKALAEPDKAAKSLDASLNFLTSAQIRNIRTLTDQGRSAEAQSEIIEALRKRIAGAASETGLWDRTLNALSNTWDKLGRTIAAPADDLAAVQARLNVLRSRADTPSNRASVANYQMQAQSLLNDQARADFRAADQAGAASVENERKAVDDLVRPLQSVAEKKRDIANQQERIRRLQPFAASQERASEYARALEVLDGQYRGLLSDSEKAQQSARLEAEVLAAPIAQRDVLRARLTAETEARTLNLSAAEREAFVQARVGQVATQRAAQILDAAEASLRQAEASKAVADAYEISTASGLREQALQASLEQARRSGASATDAQAEAQRQLTKAYEDGRGALARTIADSERRADQAETLARASRGGATAERAALMGQQADDAVRGQLDSAMASGDAAKIASVLGQRRAMLDAMQRAQAADTTRQGTGSIQETRADLDLQQRMNAAQLEGADAVRAVQVEEQKLQFARRLGARSLQDMTPEVEALTNQYGELAAQQVDLQKEIERDPWKGAKASAVSYFDNLQNLGSRTGQFLTRSVFNPLEDSLTNFFTTGKITAASFFDSLKSGLARLAAQDVIGAVGKVIGLGSGSGSGSLIGAGVSAIGSWLGFAQGGHPEGNRWAVVGEQGPELVRMGAGARVFNNAESMGMLASANDNRAVASTLQTMGRGGDTLLAHINPREAAMLKAMGGSGARNPRTGLLEFDDGGGFDAAGFDGPGGYSGGPGMGGYSGDFSGDDFTGAAEGYAANAAAAMAAASGMMGGNLATLAENGRLGDYVAEYNQGNFNAAIAALEGRETTTLEALADFLGISTAPGVGFMGSTFASRAIQFVMNMLTAPLGPVGQMAANAAVSVALSTFDDDYASNRGVIGRNMASVLNGNQSFSDALGNIGQSVTDTLNGAFGLGGNTGASFAGGNFSGGGGGFSGGDFAGSSTDLVDALTTPPEARQQAFLMSAAGGMGGFASGLASAYQPVLTTSRGILGSLPGFANGGTYTVGGTGGTDSVVPLARMTPGEQVTVRTPAQVRAGEEVAQRSMALAAQIGQAQIDRLDRVEMAVAELTRTLRLKLAA